MRSICALCMNIAFISFLGFCVENLWLAITKGYMDNRNMLFPFLFGYHPNVEITKIITE